MFFNVFKFNLQFFGVSTHRSMFKMAYWNSKKLLLVPNIDVNLFSDVEKYFDFELGLDFFDNQYRVASLMLACANEHIEIMKLLLNVP